MKEDWKLRRTTLLMVFALIVCFACFAANATPSNPYTAGCHFGPPGDMESGTAYTDKCSCNPVDNFLAARVKLQYLRADGDTYGTTSWSRWKEGTNVRSSYVRVTGEADSTATYIWGEHDGRCGNGEKQKKSTHKSR